jgi:alpha-glucosidase
MIVVKGNEMVSLYLKGEEVFSVNISKPILQASYGIDKINMKAHGEFSIKDKVSSKIDFYIDNIDEENEKIYAKSNSGEEILLTFFESEGRLHSKFKVINGNVNRFYITLPSSTNEHYYGCGEQYIDFDLKGQLVKNWVTEHQGFRRLVRKAIRLKVFHNKKDKVLKRDYYGSYYVQPTFISSKCYYIHVQTDSYMEFDFRQENKTILTIWGESKEIIFGKENNFEELFSNMTTLLGRQVNLPSWVYNGIILGIQGGIDTVFDKVDLALKAGVKVSGVWCQDWEGVRITSFGKQLMWNWKADEGLYPNLKENINKLNKKGIKFLGYINPFLAIEGDLYKEASMLSYIIKDKDGKDYMVKITTFPAAMIDLTNPKARSWIKDVIKKNMIDIGLSGWMADFGEYLPVDCVLYSGEEPKELHNPWPVLWAKVNREAIEESGKLGEVMFFTRAGYTGTSKYSTLMWTGDQHVDFSIDDGFASVIPAMLSMSCSGYGISHSDIGGYTTLFGMKRSKELFKRWAEVSCFTPVMRNHEGNRPDDNWQFDSDIETLDFYKWTSLVYTTISPYMRDLVDINSKKGVPVIRPLFMRYPEEEECHKIKYEFMLGFDMVVCPVIKEGATKITVYLPNDEFIHAFTGAKYGGGHHEIDAPVGNIPVFYRKNSNYREVFEKLKLLK